MNNTEETLKSTTKKLFALSGYEGFSMRTLSSKSGVGLSSIYHFFNDKDQLLHEVFNETRLTLGAERSKLYTPTTASEMLKQRIIFQFHHIEDVIFIIKYYLHFREFISTKASSYSPENSYKHIKETIVHGINNSEFSIKESEIDNQAKVVTHAINGFLLEYYPSPPSGDELRELIDSIHMFVMKSLTNREVPMS